MRLVECINDTGWKPESIKYIDNFPIKSEVYTVRSSVIFNGQTGYLLEEITNPIMPNGYEPNFRKDRFKEIHDNLDLKLLLKQTEEIYEDI